MRNLTKEKLNSLKKKFHFDYFDETKKKEKISKEIKNLNPDKSTIELLNHSDIMRKVLNLRTRESDIWWKTKRKYKEDSNLITIGIPTIPRIIFGKTKDYLKTTIESLYNCLLEYKKYFPNSIHKIKVFIQLSDPKSNHTIFENLSKDLKFKEDFYFYRPKKRELDTHKDIPGHDYTAPQNYIPGSKARQQT